LEETKDLGEGDNSSQKLDDYEEEVFESSEPSYHDPQGETNMARITEEIKLNNKIRHKI
jgi:hypothetical protein